MKWYVLVLVLCFCGIKTSKAQAQPTQSPSPRGPQITAPKALTEIIAGTVTDASDKTVPRATVVLEGPNHSDQRKVVTKDDGFFQFSGLQAGVAYHVTVSAKGFAKWTSPAVILQPNQYRILAGTKLQPATAQTTVTVAAAAATPVEIAKYEVKIAEKQRVFGIFPNFYVSYNQDAVPLTPKLKFRLALRTSVDPVTILGIVAFAGIDQAANRPDYEQGAAGYAKRLGAATVDSFSDIMIGGAILPSLLHQDPRYFYLGPGTNKSRALHALSHPFVCRGDNGKMQPNYSSIGGDLAASALTNLYYPPSNRGGGLVLENFLITTGERMLASVVQEFILGKFTTRGNKIKQSAADPKHEKP
jgi:hypothetical protein